MESINQIWIDGEQESHEDFLPVVGELLTEARAAVLAVTGKRLADSFTKHDDGAKGKSSVLALRRILETEFSLRGWELKWKMFPGELGLQGAPFMFDAFKSVSSGAKDYSVAVKFGWDTTNGAGSNLVRADLLKTREISSAHHDSLNLSLILAPTDEFRVRANLDNNASTVEFYRTLRKAYSAIVRTPTLIIPIRSGDDFVVHEFKLDGKKRARIVQV